MSVGFRTFNPTLNTWNDEVYVRTSENEVNQKLKLLPSAQDSYRRLSVLNRADYLHAIHRSLQKRMGIIKDFYLKESGLSESRFETEWKRTLDTIILFEQYLRSHPSFEKKGSLPTDSIQMRKAALPIGPILVLGSSNFPLAYSTVGGDTVAAFAAGCCVIVKAHPMHAGTSSVVAACIEEARKALNLPEGLFTHILDDGIGLAQQLCLDERIQGIGFTGSFKGGKALMDLAQTRKNPIPVFAEMGSVNPVIILQDLSTDQQQHAAKKLAFSIGNDAGQFCTKPGLIFIPKGEMGSSFLTLLIRAYSEISPVPMLHPRIHENFDKRRKDIISLKGVQHHTHQGELNGIEGRCTLAETVMSIFLQSQSMHEEVFGPFSLIVRYENSEELRTGIQTLSGQLTGSLFYGNHCEQVDEWIHLLTDKVGRIVLNDVPTGVRVMETMHHGGPFPASSDARFTAVGTDSMLRFQKYVTIQQQNIT